MKTVDIFLRASRYIKCWEKCTEIWRKTSGKFYSVMDDLTVQSIRAPLDVSTGPKKDTTRRTGAPKKSQRLRARHEITISWNKFDGSRLFPVVLTACFEPWKRGSDLNPALVRSAFSHRAEGGRHKEEEKVDIVSWYHTVWCMIWLEYNMVIFWY